MIRKFAPIWSAAWRGIVVLLIVEIAVVSLLRYVTGGDTPPPPIAANAFAHPFLVIHVVASVIALLVGPLQFVRRLRTRRPALHRATGYVYITACAIGAPAGFMIALGTTSGPLAASGFATAALLWAAFTWRGLRAAVDRRFAEHREWMLRSWAMTAAAITLRLMLALLRAGARPRLLHRLSGDRLAVLAHQPGPGRNSPSAHPWRASRQGEIRFGMSVAERDPRSLVERLWKQGPAQHQHQPTSCSSRTILPCSTSSPSC